METSRNGLEEILAFITSEYNLFVFPNTKKERVSFTAREVSTGSDFNIIATRNVKYYIKRFLKSGELWRLEGVFNSDKSTLYLERATRILSHNDMMLVADKVNQIRQERGEK